MATANCPTCGSECEIVSGDDFTPAQEGDRVTCHYEPTAEAQIAAARAICQDVMAQAPCPSDCLAQHVLAALKGKP